MCTTMRPLANCLGEKTTTVATQAYLKDKDLYGCILGEEAYCLII